LAIIQIAKDRQKMRFGAMTFNLESLPISAILELLIVARFAVAAFTIT
jgi:hypothetical protein